MFPALASLTGGGGLSGGTAGPSTSGDARGGPLDGQYGITSPVVIGGFKSDGSAAGGVLPGWVLPAIVGVGLVAAWSLLRRRRG